MKIGSDEWLQTVIDGALALGLEVTVDQARSMGRHAHELLQWNRVTNLTRITDPLEVALKHYVDTVAASAWIDNGIRVLDAGSGGGFPGIPLKIVRPDLAITLADGVRKKVSFLKHAIRTLGLVGINAVHGRLENLSELPEHREKFDMVVCRAFSSLEDFTKLALPFLSPGGSLLAMKGKPAGYGHQTSSAADTRVFTVGATSFSMQMVHYRLPLLGAQRNLVKLTPISEV